MLMCVCDLTYYTCLRYIRGVHSVDFRSLFVAHRLAFYDVVSEGLFSGSGRSVLLPRWRSKQDSPSDAGCWYLPALLPSGRVLRLRGPLVRASFPSPCCCTTVWTVPSPMFRAFNKFCRAVLLMAPSGHVFLFLGQVLWPWAALLD